jgi:serine/threonine protein phosphatase 1
MLNLFRKRREAPAPAISEETLVYAIGDVHGCSDLLDRLIQAIDHDATNEGGADPMLVFMGDVIDRGPNSAQVLDKMILLRASRPNTRFLMGNHEQVFLSALDGDDDAFRAFCRIGGRETILSYGLDPSDYTRMGYDELRYAMLAIVPDRHRSFIATFEDLIVVGDYAFVHAGIHPDRSIEQQRIRDLRWIRSPFLNYRGELEKVVVHGHTITDEVDWRSHRIGIDTGAYRSGRLTALALRGKRRWTIEARSSGTAV